MLKKFFLLLIIIGIGWFIYNTGIISYKKYNLNLEIQKIKKEIDALQAKNDKLKSLFEIFQSPEFLEKEARKKFNLQKEGEKTVVIIDDKKEEKNQLVKKNKGIFDDLFGIVGGNLLDEQNKENIQKWIDYFFGGKSKSINQ